LSIVGASQNHIEGHLETIEISAIHITDRFESLKNIEGSIMDFNQAKIGYEAQMLMISKVQNLSLVNYL